MSGLDVQKLYKSYDGYVLDIRFCNLIAERLDSLQPRRFVDKLPAKGQAVFAYNTEIEEWVVLHYNFDFHLWITKPLYSHWVPMFAAPEKGKSL